MREKELIAVTSTETSQSTVPVARLLARTPGLTMLSHWRDQIVEEETSIFRVTPRQKPPVRARVVAAVQFFVNTSIYLSLFLPRVYIYPGDKLFTL